jgi:hypothetical protein
MRYFISNSILAIGIITSVLIASCSKNGAQPYTSISDSGQVVVTASPDTLVFASGWIRFSQMQNNGQGQGTGCSSCNLVFQENVPELSTSILNGGKVLVYVKFADVEVEILPTNTIGLVVESSLIQISTPPENFGSIVFRYILIPSNALPDTTNLNFSDYNAVVAYYNLPQ